MVQGLLVHAVLDALKRNRPGGPGGQERTQAPESPRALAKQVMVRLLRDLMQENPRSNLDWIRARLSVDDCVNQVKHVIRRTRPPAPLPAPIDEACVRGATSSLPSSGSEVWVSVDTPPIAGRLDVVDEIGILDYKTGEPSEAHHDQLRFYALLWWLRTNQLPKSLRIEYLHSGEEAYVPVPSEGELREQAKALVREIEEIASCLRDGRFEARPNVKRCRHCPVRQLCEEYWRSEDTLALRQPVPHEETEELLGLRHVLDIELHPLPPGWKPGTPCAGRGEVAEIGPVQFAIDRSRVPSESPRVPRAARILGAGLVKEPGDWRIVLLRSSEVFWLF